MKPAAEQLAILRRGTVEIIGENGLAEQLAEGKKLRVKAGFDPTAPDLHLGHAVLLTKMRQFQQLGHQVIFLIGDFTALIGDPSGRNEARPLASAEQVLENSTSYSDQVYKILDRDLTEVRRNSEWMGKMAAAEMVALAQSYTVARLLERDDFAERLGKRQPISVHELLYPLVQGYDSCMLECDVELGGNRPEVQPAGRARPAAPARPAAAGGPDHPPARGPGRSGARCPSRTETTSAWTSRPGKYTAKSCRFPTSSCGATSSFCPCARKPNLSRIRERVDAGGNPRDAKMELAHEIAQRLHDRAAADAAAEQFAAQFQRHEIPDEVPGKDRFRR